MPGRNLIILDADGVFMSEMPYWRTALVAALDLHGLKPAGEGGWSELAEACLVRRRLQAVTKRRGCNSNWDFCAVIARSLESEQARCDVNGALARSDYDTCAAALEAQMEALWSDSVDYRAPLEGFGIARPGPYFDRAVERFQAVFMETLDIDWRFDKHALIEPADRTRGALKKLRDAGATLAVCTSRTYEETAPPMQTLGIAEYFDADRIVTHDDVRRGQKCTGVRPLSKPHWFPLAVASCGFEQAVEAVHNEIELTSAGDANVIYIGDAPADFIVATQCRKRGLPVRYVHIEAGITSDAQRCEIADSDMTLALVDDLAAAASEVLAWSA